MNTKICKTCGQEKALSLFCFSPRAKDKLTSECNRCAVAYRSGRIDKVYKYRAYPVRKAGPGQKGEVLFSEEQERVLGQLTLQWATYETWKAQMTKEGREFTKFESPLHWSTKNTIADFRAASAKKISRNFKPLKTDAVCQCGETVSTGDMAWIQFKPKFKVVGCIKCGAGLRKPDPDFFQIGGQLTPISTRDAPTAESILEGSCSRAKILGNGRRRILELAQNKGEWVRFEIVYHRPLPPGARVTAIRFIKERVGTKHQWHALISVNMERGAEPVKRGTLVFVLGFRNKIGGIRVAMWRDDSGNRGEVVFPKKLVQRAEKLEELESIMDKSLDGLREALVALRKSQNWPDWLQQKTAYVHLWKSPEKFINLLREWRGRVSPADQPAFDCLQHWYHWKDAEGHTHGYGHLREWETQQRARLNRQKIAFYRLASRGFHRGPDVRKYATVKLEAIDGAEMAEVDTDPEQRLPQAVRRNRQLSAPFMYRSEIKMLAGANAVLVDPRYSSQECPDCGHRHKFDPGPIKHTCPSCNVTYDRDDKACRVLLKRPAMSDKDLKDLSQWIKQRNKEQNPDLQKPTTEKAAA